MDTEEIRRAMAEMRGAFEACVSVTDDPEAEALTERFGRGFDTLHEIVLAHDAEGETLVWDAFEEALMDDEPWALEAHELRFDGLEAA